MMMIGVNENYQWIGQSFRELPNGIGIGGQVGFFALWIDPSMRAASTIPTASHGNTPLVDAGVDGMGKFEIDAIEVWRVSFPEEEVIGGDAGGDAIRGTRTSTTHSVLDAYRTDRNFMALAGQQSYSDGLR